MVCGVRYAAGAAPINRFVRTHVTTATPFAASPTKRLYAAIIDLALVGAVSLVLSPIDWDVGASSQADLFVALIYLVYQAAFLHFWRGQTPGRRLQGFAAHFGGAS